MSNNDATTLQAPLRSTAPEDSVIPPPEFPAKRGTRPEARDVRGRCEVCGEELVSNFYYVAEHGYVIAWQCWNSLVEAPSCGYRRVI